MTKRKKRTVKDLAPWQQKLHEVIFGYTTPAGKLFDVILLWAILASVISMMLESVSDIRIPNQHLFRVLEWSFTTLFTLEYLSRIASSPQPKKYITSFMGLIDLVSILPTFVGIFVSGTSSLMIIRSVRLIRVFRVLKLTHFMGGANQIGNALWNSRHKITVFLGTVVCVTVIIGTLMYLIEGAENGFTSIPRSIYWAIVTVTTVGYGDIAPSTILGQFLASCLMITGYAILAVPTGIVTSEMVTAKSKMDRCESCNELLSLEHAKYCHNCGTKIASTELLEENTEL